MCNNFSSCSTLEIRSDDIYTKLNRHSNRHLCNYGAVTSNFTVKFQCMHLQEFIPGAIIKHIIPLSELPTAYTVITTVTSICLLYVTIAPSMSGH
jgi:hypothetical protein